MTRFIFKSYNYDEANSTAIFKYGFADGRNFKETIKFKSNKTYNNKLLNQALFLAFVLIGTSYYKTFPSREVEVNLPIDSWQANFFNLVYQEGLSQFAFENKMNRDDLAHFKATNSSLITASEYSGSGILALQSGGKDSLLTASLLKNGNTEFVSLFVSSSDNHPRLLDKVSSSLVTDVRVIDRNGLDKAMNNGGKNGHVPVTYIIQSLALIQAILLGKKYVLTSIAHEGEEPRGFIGDLPVNHQWSKTWEAEKAFSEYVSRYISPDLRVGSPLRAYSELRIAELFTKHAWSNYGQLFSSCNIANYQQGIDNTKLNWCGNCPKCANTYLLFAPFLPAEELKSIFANQDLFEKPTLENTFKGLLGIDNVPKPFECVGEIEELRLAYHLSQKNGYRRLPFSVPNSSFDYMKLYPAQEWAVKMLE